MILAQGRMTKKNPADRVPAASASTSGSNKAYFSLLFLATMPPLCIMISFCVGRHYGEERQLQMGLKYPPIRFNFVPHSATERKTSFKEDEWKSIDFNDHVGPCNPFLKEGHRPRGGGGGRKTRKCCKRPLLQCFYRFFII